MPTSISPAERSALYAALVASRKSCRACTGLINPATCDGGVHDSEHIGPWSLCQGNLHADLLIVGRDWGDTRYFITNGAGKLRATQRTKRCVTCSLQSVSISPRPRPPMLAKASPSGQTPCVKDSGMQAKANGSPPTSSTASRRCGRVCTYPNASATLGS